MNQENFSGTRDFADVSYASSFAGDGAKERRGFGRDGEEQAVIFSAMEREPERVEILAGERGGNRDFRKLVGPNARANAAGSAEASEVGGKTVGNVHHGRRNAAARESLSKSDGNSRIKVRLKVFFQRVPTGQSAKKDFEAKLRRAKSSGDINRLAGFGTRTWNGHAGERFAENGNRDGHERRSGDIAADEAHIEFTSGAGHSRGEKIKPFACLAGRQGDGQKKIARVGAHGRDVTGGTGQTSITNGSRRMSGIAEVDVFQGEIAAQYPFSFCRRAKYCSVVSNSQAYPRMATGMSNGWNLLHKPIDHLNFPVLLTSCNRHRQSLITTGRGELCLPDYRGHPEDKSNGPCPATEI